MKDTEPEVEQEAEPAGNTVEEPNQEQEYQMIEEAEDEN